jgi:hypothetical protein
MKKNAVDLQPGEKIRVSARRIRHLVTEHQYDDSQSHYEPALADDGEVELVVRGNYADTSIRCLVVGTGLASGEFVGSFHASNGEEFDVVEPEPEPGDYTLVDVALNDPIMPTEATDSRRESFTVEIALVVRTANGRTFTITIDVDDLESMLYDFDVAGVDTNGEPIAEPEFGAVVSLLAAVTKEIEA